MRRLALAALGVAALAGCPSELLPVAPVVPSASPVFSSPRPTATPRPSATPARARWQTNSLTGAVRHADGRAVTGADVRVHAPATARIAFDATAPVVDGRYGLTGVPSQTNLTVDVVRAGAVAATRTVRFTGLEERAVASFGEASADDPKAADFPVP